MTTFEQLLGTMKFVDSAERKTFEMMLTDYMSDLPANFYLNQFDLASKYEYTDYANWVRMLKHPSFNTWKSEQIAIIATTSTDRALAGGSDLEDRDALNLLRARKDVLDAEQRVDKPTVIVVPESLFFTDDD